MEPALPARGHRAAATGRRAPGWRCGRGGHRGHDDAQLRALSSTD